ncbi:MAG: sulfatase [Planctomycetes bacterium]|nr:sulfatase [Planctomycetota bacterium]
MNRRKFLASAAAGAGAALAAVSRGSGEASPRRKPNLVFVLADQWRAQAAGYAGDPGARTPNLDRLARQCADFTGAVSCCPVCSPYRACLMTGRYPLTHGVFLNDVCLSTEAVSLAQALGRAGYDTGYIGKWHLDGHGRSAFIPRERRQGFQFWKALECTHNYNRSFYYGDADARLQWEGYDAQAQTQEACRYVREHAGGAKPFALVLSWGPPHEPYETAPEDYRKRFPAEGVALRPNVPADRAAAARRDLAGYYAHIAALDDCAGTLMAALRDAGIEDDTVFVFTSDHGDMLHSHGFAKKQQPWDESVRVPLLVRYPAVLGRDGRQVDVPVNSPDIMPTLLGLAGAEIPATVEGIDFSALLRGTGKPDADGALIMCPAPFGQWPRSRGGKEWRGVRTRRHTYVRDLAGPWLLYDYREDPYQERNLAADAGREALRKELDELLAALLRRTRDEFLPARSYIDRWGYKVDDTGTVPYAP